MSVCASGYIFIYPEQHHAGIQGGAAAKRARMSPDQTQELRSLAVLVKKGSAKRGPLAVTRSDSKAAALYLSST